RNTDDESEWRPTGDLVEIRDDRIHFVGRKTEIINVGGAKVHPLPVEEAVCSVPGVQLAAVYGRPNAVTGPIVAVDLVPAPAVGFYYVAVDLADPAACDRFIHNVIDRFGRIDVLVNNAGIARDGVLPLARDADIDQVIDLNLRATIHITRAVSRRMLTQHSGR